MPRRHHHHNRNYDYEFLDHDTAGDDNHHHTAFDQFDGATCHNLNDCPYWQHDDDRTPVNVDHGTGWEHIDDGPANGID